VLKMWLVQDQWPVETLRAAGAYEALRDAVCGARDGVRTISISSLLIR
jgi:hypothetical protein